MAQLFEKIGETKPDYLLSDPWGAHRVTVPMKPGNGVVKRGAIIYEDSATGMFMPAASSDVAGNKTLMILDEETDTDASATVAENARAFDRGNFALSRLILSDNADITAAMALVMRQQNLELGEYLEHMRTYANGFAAITYVANNGVSPAEADYVAYAREGSAYAVLSNTTTGFTAPASKSFSKWNTKADGSGTDYAAGASYAANAGITLYAVWA